MANPLGVHVVGGRLKALMKLRGVNQQDLRKALGYSSTGTVSQIVNGERGMSAEKIIAAADFLEVPVEMLVSEDLLSKKDTDLVFKVLKVLKGGGEQSDVLRDLIGKL